MGGAEEQINIIKNLKNAIKYALEYIKMGIEIDVKHLENIEYMRYMRGRDKNEKMRNTKKDIKKIEDLQGDYAVIIEMAEALGLEIAKEER